MLVVALLSICVWTGAGQSQRVGRVSYEYQVVDGPSNAVNFDEGMKKLNQLGAQGWELAGVSATPNIQRSSISSELEDKLGVRSDRDAEPLSRCLASDRPSASYGSIIAYNRPDAIALRYLTVGGPK